MASAVLSWNVQVPSSFVQQELRLRQLDSAALLLKSLMCDIIVFGAQWHGCIFYIELLFSNDGIFTS